MQAKALEIRDEGTFIPLLAVDMNPGPFGDCPTQDGLSNAQGYLLRRCGYACDGRPNIMITYLAGGRRADNDPYGWEYQGRTFQVAHKWIIENWADLRDGDVVDVQFILGETDAPKRSERFT